jgi:hypothetical protein
MTALPPPPQPIVDAIWRAREAEAAARPRYEGYGVSAGVLGTECDRAVWYGLRWVSLPEAFTGRALRIFERGNIEEARVLADLRRAGLDVLDTDPATGKQWRFALANGWLRGKADGICERVPEAPKARHALEIKSLNAADFRAIQKHGLAKARADHWHQLHAGMIGLGLARGLYVGVNKDTDDILTERVRIDHEEGARQEARVLRLVDAHEPPHRISDKPDSFACRFCDHRATCHGGAFARRHCRTCVHFTLTTDGNGHCERFDEPRKPDRQHLGADCPAHLFLPGLVPGEQVDADPDAETITYRLPDGSTFTDGAQEART